MTEMLADSLGLLRQTKKVDIKPVVKTSVPWDFTQLVEKKDSMMEEFEKAKSANFEDLLNQDAPKKQFSAMNYLDKNRSKKNKKK